MRKIICLSITVLILMSVVPTALAATTVSLSQSSVNPGDTVTISGTMDADENVVIKITDESGNIVYFDGIKADSDGNYSASFTVPSDTESGKLTVTAGSGDDVATTTMTVTSSPIPTPKATETPTSKPTETPTSKPTETPTSVSTSDPAETSTSSPTLPPGSTPAATSTTTQSGGSDPVPTQTSHDGQEAIKPIDISQDEETGVITIVIDVDDLPAGTVAIEAPDGKVVYVSDAVDGAVVIEVNAGEVNKDGTIEIVALDDEMNPLASYVVQVLDEDDELIIAKTGETGGAWIIIVCIAAGVIVLGLVVLWILLRSRKKKM